MFVVFQNICIIRDRKCAQATRVDGLCHSVIAVADLEATTLRGPMTDYNTGAFHSKLQKILAIASNISLLLIVGVGNNRFQLLVSTTSRETCRRCRLTVAGKENGGDVQLQSSMYRRDCRHGACTPVEGAALSFSTDRHVNN